MKDRKRMAEIGKLGGLATLRKHGVAHFRALGKLGFAAAARNVGSRKVLLGRLAVKGLIRLPGGELTTAETAALLSAVGLDGEIPW